MDENQRQLYRKWIELKKAAEQAVYDNNPGLSLRLDLEAEELWRNSVGAFREHG